MPTTVPQSRFWIRIKSKASNEKNERLIETKTSLHRGSVRIIRLSQRGVFVRFKIALTLTSDVPSDSNEDDDDEWWWWAGILEAVRLLDKLMQSSPHPSDCKSSKGRELFFDTQKRPLFYYYQLTSRLYFIWQGYLPISKLWRNQRLQSQLGSWKSIHPTRYINSPSETTPCGFDICRLVLVSKYAALFQQPFGYTHFGSILPR